MGVLGSEASNLRVFDFSLRLFVIPFSVGSIWIAVTNQEDNPDYGKLEFKNLIGLEYMVLAYLMVTSMAALWEFLYLAYNGDRVVSWSQACVSYGKFCSRLQLALGLHIIAVCCFVLLTVLSAYRVFKRFEPPFVPSKEPAEQEMRT